MQKLKKQNEAERTLNEIIRELKEEGINFIHYCHHNPLFNSLSYDYIVFSFDSLENMHELLYKDQSEFSKKYNCGIPKVETINYIKEHYHDKHVVKETIKNNIRKKLSKTVIDELTGEANEKRKIDEELKRLQSKFFNSKIINLNEYFYLLIRKI